MEQTYIVSGCFFFPACVRVHHLDTCCSALWDFKSAPEVPHNSFKDDYKTEKVHSRTRETCALGCFHTY